MKKSGKDRIYKKILIQKSVCNDKSLTKRNSSEGRSVKNMLIN